MCLDLASKVKTPKFHWMYKDIIQPASIMGMSAYYPKYHTVLAHHQ